MKDGRTHLAHKAEHAVDMETGAIVAVTRQGAERHHELTAIAARAATSPPNQTLIDGRWVSGSVQGALKPEYGT